MRAAAVLLLVASAAAEPKCIADNWPCQSVLKECDTEKECSTMKECVWACKDKDTTCITACHSKHVMCSGCNKTAKMENVMLCVMGNMQIMPPYDCHPHSPIPSPYLAASIVRQLVQNQTYCNMMTVMKEGGSGGGGAAEAGWPYGTIEHFAEDCTSPGNLLLFLSPLHVNTPNFEANNKVTIALRDWNDDKAVDPLLKHRMVLLGSLSVLPEYGQPGYQQYADCFFAKHPDARAWEHMPSHKFRFHRFTHLTTHYTGGFGDSHFIGWIDDSTYRAAPDTARCDAWAGCKAENATLCCPFDSDNNFRQCCGHFASDAPAAAVGAMRASLSAQH
eukprot:TRINITY_DN27730_c0_g1_i2.p2 TRINITY_DN27730_c0_g1~~TRINITY_DN27730_c0_g1_i2.p2  ORF type:complete len:358 (+),score=159.45 TRINITY_DN27730_c0_g1_i2:78-1076(+)